MKIIDMERLSHRKSIFLIECSCARRFRHRSDKPVVKCPRCKVTIDLADLREVWENE